MNNVALKYMIKTFGCQMNIADSDFYSTSFNELGCEATDDILDCDIVLVNTCVVRLKAEEKAISYLGELESIRKRKPSLRYILAGCLSPRADELALKSRFPGLLFTINPSDIEKFPLILREYLEGSVCVEHTSMENLSGEIRAFHSFVTVMRGCEKYCSYCIVPYARGNNFSRPQEEILQEIKSRVLSGAQVITLLGQSILDYGKDWQNEKKIAAMKGDSIFRELLDKVSSTFPDTWIKFLTSHPRDLTHETIDLIADRMNISKYIHIPIQSGDDEILKRMGRGHNREYYFELVKYIREKMPDARVSSDIIVGFPGETSDAFEMSLDLLKRVRFIKLFTFQYSIRPGTPAEKFDDNVSFDEKRKRLNQLIMLQNQITLECHKELEGREMVAIVESESRTDPDSVLARSRDEDIIILERENDIETGDKVLVKIMEGRLRTLRGKLIQKIDG